MYSNSPEELLQACQLELKKYQQAAATLQRQEHLNKALVSKLTGENKELAKELGIMKEHTRKLEHRLSTVKTDNYLADLNFHLQERLNKLREEVEARDTRIQTLLTQNTELKNRERTLTQSLKVHAKEFGVDGSVLYELTSLRKVLAEKERAFEKQKSLVASLQSQLEGKLVQIEELELIQESNTQELERLETENFKLSQDNIGLTEKNQGFIKERSGLFEKLERLTANEKKNEKDFEQFSEELQQLNTKYLKDTAAYKAEIEKGRKVNDELMQTLGEYEGLLQTKFEEVNTLKAELEASTREVSRQADLLVQREREVVVLRNKNPNTDLSSFSRDRLSEISLKMQGLSRNYSQSLIQTQKISRSELN